MQQRIHPSLITQSQQELLVEAKKLHGLAKHLHLDIVDGKFAPNSSFQFPFRLPREFTYSAHLMIKKPDAWVQKYGARVELCIPHVEELQDVSRYVQQTRKQRKKVAVALLPETPVTLLKPVLRQLDYVLILTVHPGFYGSTFLPTVLKKIRDIKSRHPRCAVIVDGCMNPETIVRAAKAGADYFVSGSFIQKAASPRAALRELQDALQKALFPKKLK